MSQMDEVCSYLIFLPLNCPPTQTPPMPSFEISFCPQISCIPTTAYKSFRGSYDHSERAQRFWTSMKVSISGISCQPDLHFTLSFMPSRTAPSLCPRALSHPRVWAKCPCPHVCHTPIVTFTTLHLSPRPLLGLLEGPGGSKAQLAGRDSRILLYFCNKELQRIPATWHHFTCILYDDHFVCFALFSLILFLCSSSA